MTDLPVVYAPVLVIAADGLGSFVQALGAVAAIRIHHPGARVILLAAANTVDFAVGSPFVDEVWADEQHSWRAWRAARTFRDRLRGAGFARVYDLDGGDIGRRIFRLMYGWRVDAARRATIQWSGEIAGALFGDPIAGQASLHRWDRLAAQLKRAGVPELTPVDLTWVASRVTGFSLPFRMTEPFTMIVTDGPHRNSAQGWPPDRICVLAERIASDGAVPVLVGLTAAPDLVAAVQAVVPRAVDLTGRANISDLVFLAWAARGAVGCDTGLMHLFAAADCRAVVLYDASSDPALSGQRGRGVIILRRQRLADIPVGEVAAALRQKR